MAWKIKITSETTDPSGKRRTWTRTLDPARRTMTSGWARIPRGPDDIKAYIVANLPSCFHGCNIDIITPLHHNTGHIDPDTREFVYDMGPNG